MSSAARDSAAAASACVCAVRCVVCEMRAQQQGEATGKDLNHGKNGIRMLPLLLHLRLRSTAQTSHFTAQSKTNIEKRISRVNLEKMSE